LRFERIEYPSFEALHGLIMWDEVGVVIDCFQSIPTTVPSALPRLKRSSPTLMQCDRIHQHNHIPTDPASAQRAIF